MFIATLTLRLEDWDAVVSNLILGLVGPLGGRIFTRGAYRLHKPPEISHKRSEKVGQNTVLDKTLILKWLITNEIY